MLDTIFDNISPRLCHYTNNTPLTDNQSSYGERIVQHYELELITSGYGYIIVNGIPIPTIPNTLNFRTPGMKVEGIGIYQCRYMTLDLDTQAQVFSELENLPIVYRHIDTAYLMKFFEWINHCASLPKHSQILLFKSHICDLFDKMMQEYQTYSDHIYNPIRCVPKSIQHAIEYIQSHYANAISLETLARIAGYSTYHFCRTFKQMTSWTPTQYITQYRINKAKQRMVLTNKPIDAIYLECGFNSYSYFFRVFKSLYGISPHEYRIRLSKKQPE